MITDLRDMMEERLLAYRAKNRDLPQRILVYRDGVSEVRRLGFLSYYVVHLIRRLFRVNSPLSSTMKFPRYGHPSGSSIRPKVLIARS